MIYRIPRQDRALRSENAYLDAFERLIAERGYTNTSVDAIAREVGLTKAAFLARFGSKKAALLLLFDRYCAKASAVMHEMTTRVPAMASAEAAVYELSTVLEKIQLENFAPNRAMQELFLEELKVDERTQKIFLELVDLMRLVQKHHLAGAGYTDTGAFSGSQVLVSVNFNYILRAMPALPRDHDTRHRMIALMTVAALRF
jgi:AcrR family transcriptional regulator